VEGEARAHWWKYFTMCLNHPCTSTGVTVASAWTMVVWSSVQSWKAAWRTAHLIFANAYLMGFRKGE
jgi:hypothetical protein